MKDLLLKQTPFLGFAYGFSVTIMKVFNSTSLTGACSEVAKEIIVNYIPPVFKYSILCSKLFTTGTVCVVTGGNPVAFAAFIHIGRLIVEAY